MRPAIAAFALSALLPLWGVLADAAAPPMPPGLEDHWQALRGEDARKAGRAIWALADTPAASVPFLRLRLRPVPHIDRKLLAQCIADLGSADFAVREKAEQRLAAFGEPALPALRKALSAKPGLEVHRRIERVVARIALLDRLPPPPESLRQYRGWRPWRRRTQRQPASCCANWHGASPMPGSPWPLARSLLASPNCRCLGPE